jgi:hypothetical protein
MDFFGIGAAMKGMCRVYIQSSRGSGRTISLVEGVKDGDRVCFTNRQEADRVKRLFKERGVNVECIVVSTREPQRIFERGTSQGRTIFDHSWVEEFYMDRMEECQKELEHLERQSSGYGEAHRETRRKAIEMSKWVF